MSILLYVCKKERKMDTPFHTVAWRRESLVCNPLESCKRPKDHLEANRYKAMTQSKRWNYHKTSWNGGQKTYAHPFGLVWCMITKSSNLYGNFRKATYGNPCPNFIMRIALSTTYVRSQFVCTLWCYFEGYIAHSAASIFAASACDNMWPVE